MIKRLFNCLFCAKIYLKEAFMEEFLTHDHGEVSSPILKKYLSSYDFKQVADVFSQLGDGTRLKIFWLLCHTEECVINISTYLDMTSPLVSHHLKKLKESGLVTSRRIKKEVFYKAADSEKCALLHTAIEAVMNFSACILK